MRVFFVYYRKFPHTQMQLLVLHHGFNISWCQAILPNRVSSPREFHPQALSEPYVNLSTHTAPIIQSFIIPFFQCTKSSGDAFAILASHFLAFALLFLSFLYLFITHFSNALLIYLSTEFSSDRQNFP